MRFVTLIIVDLRFKNEVYTRFVRLFHEFLAIGLPVSQVDTRTDGSCPSVSDAESIRQHFTPSVNTLVYFSKSLAIGLPVNRTETKRDGSCPSVSDRILILSVNTVVCFFQVSPDRTSRESDRCISQKIRLSSGVLDMHDCVTPGESFNHLYKNSWPQLFKG